MKALSIRQPWAWAIVRPDITAPEARAAAYERGIMKDIENRTWPTRFRGEFLIHAAVTLDDIPPATFEELFGVRYPKPEEMQRGGIIGQATLAACFEHDGRTVHGDDLKRNTEEQLRRWRLSRWAAAGQCWFAIRDAEPRTFRPLRGALGFFEVL